MTGGEPTRLNAAWLSEVLGATVTGVRWRPVGTGQMSGCFRGELTGDGAPARLVAKLPAADQATREMLKGIYRTEVRFYLDLASTVAVRTPACRYGMLTEDATDFVLLLEDLHPGAQGDQLAGCTAAEALDCVVNLAGLHGPRWCDPALLDLDWLHRTGPEDGDGVTAALVPATEIFIDRFAGRLAAEDEATLRAVALRAGPWITARPERFSLVHGDYRLDNIIFAADGGPGVAAVDWQTLTVGLPARDLAYFLGTGLTVADRRTRERDLVAAYHRALAGHGVTGYSLEQCWDDYVFAFLQGPLITVLGCAYGTPTERGDEMFLAMAARSCAAIRDHGSLDKVP
ncbi:phosphotransferase [Actinomadura luteofluorescens]|uniref:phosphotransferase family protein n=1 Tax=Actinomadura luteofluorescens TaxID=46163 RepID=UPI00216429C2|nr:ecdysteroid 22-kinase family protein [Actinomadura glauciflava]MCR3740365.1 Phosphotransferase enzyme family protein [Actinomadura glauciflava]